MVKTRKGRSTNEQTAHARPKASNLRQAIESAKEKRTKTNEIDVTKIADDDPTPSLRERVRGFMALMGDDSSEEDESTNEPGTTPRRGEDKKRQRFAEEAEIIEVEQEEDDFSIETPPEPTRLLTNTDTESISSDREVTIADILGEGPENVVEFPEPLVITKDCRYTLQITVPPCENPTAFIAEKYTALLKWLQNKIGKDISIATWDDDPEKQHIYARTSQLPKPSEPSLWTSIWGNWVSLKPQQEGRAFVKIRFVTKSPTALTRRLTEIGELKDEIYATCALNIGRAPIACQAVQVSCVGWFFGSNKHMNGDDLLAEIKRLIKIPGHVRMGISWRAIKLETGKTPPWIDDIQPASALHVDIDWFHAPVYKPMLANLFKKHGHTKPLGLSLRLIPCFSSDEGKNSTPDQRASAIDMREKQEYVIQTLITIIKTPYILNLDRPTKQNGTMTLRRYLKNLHPEGLVAARLIISADKSWRKGSKETVLVTTKEFAPQVQEAVRNMIPECVHRFGKGTKGWFTREGLQAFQGVQWDPSKNKSVSDRDVEALRVVNEDYFGMGEAWRQHKASAQRPNRNSEGGRRQESEIFTAPRTTGNGQKKTTVETLMNDIANPRADAPSFGDVYNRPHDGDTAKTSIRQGNDDASLSSHESDCQSTSVTFANLSEVRTGQHRQTQNIGDNSTAKSSTHYRLQRDKSRAIAEKSQEESRVLQAELQAERDALAKAREELERMRVSTKQVNQVTPSAKKVTNGTAADSVVRQHE